MPGCALWSRCGASVRASPAMRRLRERKEWKLFAALAKADPVLAGVWWVALVLRGVLPALFGIAMGVLVAAVQRGSGLAAPLTFAGAVFVLLQILPPIQTSVSWNLGDRTAAWLYDRLTAACVQPPGMGHLEDPKLTGDLTVARDFDLGMTGPPLSISMDFIAGSLVEMFAGLAFTAVLASYRWWAALALGGAWLATHWLLRESSGWHDRNTQTVRAAARELGRAGPHRRDRRGGAARRRICLPARRGSARRQGAPPVRPRRLGPRPLRPAPYPTPQAAIRGHAPA